MYINYVYVCLLVYTICYTHQSPHCHCHSFPQDATPVAIGLRSNEYHYYIRRGKYYIVQCSAFTVCTCSVSMLQSETDTVCVILILSCMFQMCT